jgi:hypothetical protein
VATGTPAVSQARPGPHELEDVCEEALAERAKGNEPDAKFGQRWQHFRLRIPCPQGVLALHGRHREDGVCGPDGGG